MSTPPKPVILVVEDETLIRITAVDAFLEAGFEVLEAEHAAGALALHKRAARVDMLFTDVNMPGEMNGIDLAEHLKAAAPRLQLIITSALPILRPVGQLPATFVPKPYDPDTVCRMAVSLLAA